ncbi:excinuclease ABC subunit B [Candidatus Uhrbacteria bacterium RIFOXYC2_FULL_47_19]|uniref:UvrABC system protein B n=1 Tax=Candidatus Uhrbacteria bacterium RIFOXYC2_FULL_47_19 TaxID=1802424 RepID=A0A1F7WE86_9BACT|nr:MAG: excinuclease ABC subunit B [Candidatus Uhrbacteria bacterium RIFOXYC2_FULL_47_19]
MMDFKLISKHQPKGDQPQAIEALTDGLRSGLRHQTLLGITGSGKTFTMANVIRNLGRPALVIAHNKTLAAQLCNEFRGLFPENAVEYFVSYYDYYQPEAYLPTSDTYIEKEATINQEIDRLRHRATQSLLTRRDVIIVSSVSCIYGLGAPKTYEQMHLRLLRGGEFSRTAVMRQLVQMQYQRTTSDLERGEFRVQGNVVEIRPAAEEFVIRLDVRGDYVADLTLIDPVSRKRLSREDEAWVFPAKHFITPGPERERAAIAIRAELEEQLEVFRRTGKLLEAERLERRTNFDLAMLEEIGYCNGIENYSRHLSGRAPGEPPDTLLSYFPDDFVCFIDESHVTVSQLEGMHNGDAARKRNLIDYGFRLPSAADNRPLKSDEFRARVPQLVYVSATPADYERQVSEQIVEQVIRPTGLIDPKVTVLPASEADGQPGQVDDLMVRLRTCIEAGGRALVTTLTKKMAEDLDEYLREGGFRAAYLHSDVKTVDRIRILTEFRRGTHDIIVGVNLLREGLDLPEVTLVAIMDADREGFLRSETSLIQTIGRAARNVLGEVILYADQITGSMRRAMQETDRRREKQIKYNTEHGITPQTISKEIGDLAAGLGFSDERVAAVLGLELKADDRPIEEIISDKERQMREAAKNLEFELATVLRDEIIVLKQGLKSSNAKSRGRRPLITKKK